jgi:hypothetical protein
MNHLWYMIGIQAATSAEAMISREITRLRRLPSSVLRLSRVYELASFYPSTVVQKKQAALQELILSRVPYQPTIKLDIQALEKQYCVFLTDKGTRVALDLHYDARTGTTTVQALTESLRALVANPPDNDTTDMGAWISECRYITQKYSRLMDEYPKLCIEPSVEYEEAKLAFEKERAIAMRIAGAEEGVCLMHHAVDPDDAIESVIWGYWTLLAVGGVVAFVSGV